MIDQKFLESLGNHHSITIFNLVVCFLSPHLKKIHIQKRKPVLCIAASRIFLATTAYSPKLNFPVTVPQTLLSGRLAKDTLFSPRHRKNLRDAEYN